MPARLATASIVTSPEPALGDQLGRHVEQLFAAGRRRIGGIWGVGGGTVISREEVTLLLVTLT